MSGELAGRKRNPLKLSRLRDIGWSMWDPIGLNDMRTSESEYSIDDEYDSYLLRAANIIRNGSSAEDAAAYLYGVETEYMGLTGGDETLIRERCKTVADAIERYIVNELPSQLSSAPKTVLL